MFQGPMTLASQSYLNESSNQAYLYNQGYSQSSMLYTAPDFGNASYANKYPGGGEMGSQMTYSSANFSPAASSMAPVSNSSFNSASSSAIFTNASGQRPTSSSYLYGGNYQSASHVNECVQPPPSHINMSTGAYIAPNMLVSREYQMDPLTGRQQFTSMASAPPPQQTNPAMSRPNGMNSACNGMYMTYQNDLGQPADLNATKNEQAVFYHSMNEFNSKPLSDLMINTGSENLMSPSRKHKPAPIKENAISSKHKKETSFSEFVSADMFGNKLTDGEDDDDNDDDDDSSEDEDDEGDDSFDDGDEKSKMTKRAPLNAPWVQPGKAQLS